MQTLDLSRNTLTSLVNQTFAPLETLVELRLSQNKINTVQPSAFHGLSRLRVLYLDHNLIAEINPAWFEPLEHLRFLYLTNNLLRTLPAFTFRPLKALQILNVAQNKIHNVSHEAFYAVRSLDTLNLSKNLLNFVPNEAMGALKNLDSLDMSQNPVRSLTRNSFSTLYVLSKLKLDRMYQMSSMHLHTFVDNMQLKELSMSENQVLQPLPWGIFNANTALAHLNFANNTLWSTLSPHQIPLRSIRSLKIAGIPFYCNCSLTWLWELYQQQNQTKDFYLDEAVCQSISNAGGSKIPLRTIKVDDLACADWTFVVLVASISVLVTVGLLILVALIAYKCKQRFYAASSPCLHIKDDTMIYARAAANFQQNQLAQQGTAPVSGLLQGVPDQHLDTDSSTYAKAVLGGYSPPLSEPFYEVPRFPLPHPGNGTQHYQVPTSSDELGAKSSTSGSSKYSSSGYVGSELWENDFLGLNSQIHLNYATQRSPRSSSGLGSSTHSGSSTGSSSGNKSVFFSPARNFNNSNGVPSGLHHTLMAVSNSANNSPAKHIQPMYFKMGLVNNGVQNTQQHHLVAGNGTSIRSPKASATVALVQKQQQRNNVYV